MNTLVRYASTLVTSTVENTEDVAREVFFNVILPETAFISRWDKLISVLVNNNLQNVTAVCVSLLITWSLSRQKVKSFFLRGLPWRWREFITSPRWSRRSRPGGCTRRPSTGTRPPATLTWRWEWRISNVNMMRMNFQARHSNRFRVSVNTEAHNLVKFFLVNIKIFDVWRCN